jgi:RNA polymerase sporulation-specific sigma factor
MLSEMLVFIIGSLCCIFPLMGFVTNFNAFPHPLSSAEEKKLLEEFKNGSEDAGNALVERNLRLVAHVAKKFSMNSNESDDLISIGTIGLIKGVKSFKSEKGTRLATYAARCIENAILT